MSKEIVSEISREQEENQMEQMIIVSQSLGQLLSCLARETTLQQIFLVGSEDNEALELALKSSINTKDNLIRITANYVEINIAKCPSMRLQKAAAKVFKDFRAGELDFLCRHVHLQKIYLDRYRDILTKLKLKLAKIL